MSTDIISVGVKGTVSYRNKRQAVFLTMYLGVYA